MTGDPRRVAPVNVRIGAVTGAKASLARLRARLTTATSAALFLLPLPLLIVVASALIADDLERLTLAASALACFWIAGILTWRGLASEMGYVLGEQIDLDRIPRKFLGALLTAGGAALAALTANHGVVGAATFAALGGVGHLCFYGLDMRVRRVTVTPVEGLDVASIVAQLEQAHLRLRRIDAAANAIAVPEFRSRLAGITAAGRDILAEIARDPAKASRARRFLNLFLDSTERVTAEYARTHPGIRSRPLEENFRKLLFDMEQTFSQQQRKLLESDAVSLDVEMEVLNARLKQEGVSEYVEKRI
jgi:5-bromo-4-chloroindolyl phosphate hydrolysis protein